MLKIKILGSGCPNCKRLEQETRKAVSMMLKKIRRRYPPVPFSLLPGYIFELVGNLPVEFKTSPFPNMSAVRTMQQTEETEVAVFANRPLPFGLLLH